MKHCINKSIRSARTVALSGLLAALFAAGCTTKDDTLGANLIPDNQQLKAGYAVFQWNKEVLTGLDALNPKKYVETRLYQTDSVVSSNLKQGYLGAAYNDTVGLRTAGFLSQFSNYYLVDDGYFGYRPIFDSAQILLSVSAYGRDTMTEQKFEVYEIKDNAYLTEKPLSAGKTERDSVFYLNFDPEHAATATDADEKNILGQKLFEFTLGGDNGPSKTAVTMKPTPEGREFIQRLMLQTGERKGDYSIYDVNNMSEWFKVFKGLYIRPVDTDKLKAPGQSKGSVYTLDLSASGFAVYGRNRVEEDPSLIKDTIGMVYYFYVSDFTEGNVSVNTVRHDYTSSKIDPDEARAYIDGKPNPNRPEKSRVYVEGMGGVTTEITFTQEFFDDLQKLIDTENAESKKEFTTLAFTQVQMEIYFPDGGRYDWQDIDPSQPGITGGDPTFTGSPLVDRMNVAPSRIGMYTDYGRKVNISDYAYLYESYYGTSLAYGGYINRSHGCYRMDITSHVQEMWNQYMERGKKLEEVPLRKVYLGPEATDFFTTDFTELQGQPDDNGSESQAPIRFKIAYNLIK